MQWWWGLVFALGGLGLGLALGCWACGGPPVITPDVTADDINTPEIDEDDTDPGDTFTAMQRYPFRH